jgi:hypothetical protein
LSRLYGLKFVCGPGCFGYFSFWASVSFVGYVFLLSWFYMGQGCTCFSLGFYLLIVWARFIHSCLYRLCIYLYFIRIKFIFMAKFFFFNIYSYSYNSFLVFSQIHFLSFEKVNGADFTCRKNQAIILDGIRSLIVLYYT